MIYRIYAEIEGYDSESGAYEGPLHHGIDPVRVPGGPYATLLEAHAALRHLGDAGQAPEERPVAPVPDAWTPEAIRAFRKSHGWTQVDLANLLGTDNMTLSRWERDVQRPSRSFRLALDALRPKETPQ